MLFVQKELLLADQGVWADRPPGVLPGDPLPEAYPAVVRHYIHPLMIQGGNLYLWTQFWTCSRAVSQLWLVIKASNCRRAHLAWRMLCQSSLDQLHMSRCRCSSLHKPACCSALWNAQAARILSHSCCTSSLPPCRFYSFSAALPTAARCRSALTQRSAIASSLAPVQGARVILNLLVGPQDSSLSVKISYCSRAWLYGRPVLLTSVHQTTSSSLLSLKAAEAASISGTPFSPWVWDINHS